MTRLRITPRFTKGKTAESFFNWKRFDSEILDNEKKTFFKRTHLEFPDFWSSFSIDITASKYFRTVKGKTESSLKELVQRVSKKLRAEAIGQGYLDTRNARYFEHELRHILYSQKAAFNSPVWFNLGVFKQPQTSACFIQSAGDSLEEIFDLLKNESQIFKYGSGSGSNFSNLRSYHEKLDTGGYSSGLLAFLNVFDTAAGAIKSGGITRRAAKMVIVDVDHPEIEDFISLKAREEDKAEALVKAGFNGTFEGEILTSLKGQNANNSVRVTDQFMKAVLKKQTWSLRARKDKAVIKKIPAIDLWRSIATAAHRCADPGLQFHDTINKWNPCAESDQIYGSNPCSEFMFLNDTSCNLASINLIHFLDAQNNFLIEDFRHTIRVIFLAQELLIDFSKYPTPQIGTNSHHYRPLGLGFTNLGSFFLKLGLAYDSDQARAWASFITSLMTSEAYLHSHQFARVRGAFKYFKKNKKSFLRVMNLHAKANGKIHWSLLPKAFKSVCEMNWQAVVKHSRGKGFRNAQATVIAPTGTISFFMNAETTGIEPEFSFVKYKNLITGEKDGAGVKIKFVNQCFENALKTLQYSNSEIEQIKSKLLATGFLDEKLLRSAEHKKVFQTAVGPDSISPLAHLQMMAAVQPFVSGAISKTINLPSRSTVAEVEDTYLKAWQLGLKSVAIYRDKSKLAQPLEASIGPNCGDCDSPTELRGGCFVCLNCGTSVACG
ncbi:MAG: vitamin B12-dependent ribonucleotide reductase [Bdellovibrionaceae bacterium]|nr:vitamin B12-dependent ribonucleotide reductase [Pseudobdellovibrionaceae bacterium]